jgi:TolB protein
MKRLLIAATCLAAIAVVAAQNAPAPPEPQPAPPQSQSEINFAIVGDNNAPLHYAVPDFIALTPDPETTAAAKLMAEVLWNDLAFEREFDLIPRDTYRTIPAAQSPTDINYDRWRELGADGVVIGALQRNGNAFHVEMRLFNIRNRQVALGKQYDGITLKNPRSGAHWIADDIHEQRGLRGVARTRLTFVSDRDNERMADTVEKRDSKNIYLSDYDGANAFRVTQKLGQLNINPNWAPDGRSIAYTTYGRIVPQILVSNLYQGTRAAITDEKSQAFLPVFSPDGTKIAFMSDREGQMDIYVMSRDGSGVRRLTTSPAQDSTPTWSPSGTQIAFTSDRSGSAQLWVMDTDGLNARRLTFNDSYADRATWSPAPFNEIAYAARSGPGFDIRIYDVASGQSHQLTSGEGSNESPAFAPNGRHLAFTSTRAGKVQVFTIARDGKQITKITSAGNNWTPNWSR